MKWQLKNLLLSVWFVFCTTGSLLAQEAGRLPKQDKGIVQWVIAVVLIILIAFPGFMNPKRTHLD